MNLQRLGEAIRSGRLSPTDHINDVFGRLDADPFNTVVTLDRERAHAAAESLTRELADGRWRGPLHGVALGVKDLIDVAGLPTRCGSAVLADALPARTDAPVVASLRAAGAIVVAKLHTQEFAHGPTGDVAANGPAHNPHDPDRITGGSSSGSAAAVAAGYLPLALGSDTGGSVRIPAALCGVVGLKPSFGRLSTDGVFPLAESLDHVGLLAADARGAAIAWDVLDAGRDSGAVPPIGLQGVRLGVLTDDYWRPLDPAISAGFAATVAAAQKLGAELVELHTPMVEELAAAYPRIVGGESYATHARWLAERPDDYQPLIRERLLGFATQPAREYIEAQRTRRRLSIALQQLMSGVDALLVPTTRIRATPIGAESIHLQAADIPVRPALLALTLPFNMTGWPAVSIPAPADGLPAGVQIVGISLAERGVLELAARIEEQLG